jgi:hypothetical protein
MGYTTQMTNSRLWPPSSVPPPPPQSSTALAHKKRKYDRMCLGTHVWVYKDRRSSQLIFAVLSCLIKHEVLSSGEQFFKRNRQI